MSIFERMDRRITNMSTMLERLGIDPAQLAGQGEGTPLTVAIRRCHFCPNDSACSDFLARAPGSFDRPPAFCPNAALFLQAKADHDWIFGSNRPVH